MNTLKMQLGRIPALLPEEREQRILGILNFLYYKVGNWEYPIEHVLEAMNYLELRRHLAAQFHAYILDWNGEDIWASPEMVFEAIGKLKEMHEKGRLRYNHGDQIYFYDGEDQS